VDERHGVCGRQHSTGLRADRRRPADRQRTVLGDDVGDADALDVLHHQVRAAVRGDAGVVDGRDTGVLQARREPGLAVEAPHQLRVGHPVG
jgi:hypothetical protein